MRQGFFGIKGFQLVLVNWRRGYEDDPWVLGFCCGVLDDGLQILLVVIEWDILGSVGAGGIICTEEYCLISLLTVSSMVISPG